ncbi:heavy-metal-associated domain-containing protein [Modestobacter lapidis]|nr:heavy-metal-associated domain-containing protein [Modestobacter lapidis]
MQTQTFVVTGMTCQHCVASVTEEVGEVTGVTAVDVDLTSGRLQVTGQDVTVEQVQAAVAEAGNYSADPA